MSKTISKSRIIEGLKSQVDFCTLHADLMPPSELHKHFGVYVIALSASGNRDYDDFFDKVYAPTLLANGYTIID